MIDLICRSCAVLLIGALAACGVEVADKPVAPEKPAAVSMAGATCAVIPIDGDVGAWEFSYTLRKCLRQLAYGDWSQASAEAAHVADWPVGDSSLRELTDSLVRYGSAAALSADLKSRGLLGGSGEPDFLDYVEDDWQPVTVSDWLMQAGHRYAFDTETGMYPNYHDSLLHTLAQLFGEPLDTAEFAETAPGMDSEEPYILHATLGEKKWSREAANYGDWYDVAAVLEMLNAMASDVGLAQRAMPLATYDQTAAVVVAPGEALVDAAADGLIYPVHASEGMDRGKAFEDEMRKRYLVQ